MKDGVKDTLVAFGILTVVIVLVSVMLYIGGFTS